MSRPQHSTDSETGCPLWMLTFGDTMSLLVTFFVMLASFSNFEEAGLAELFGAYQGGLRMIPALTATRHLPPDDRSAAAKGTARGPARTADEKDYVLRWLDEGLTVVIKTEALFAAGTADFVAERQDLYRVVRDLARSIPNEIRVVGVLPAQTRVHSQKTRTPWGLATERAVAVKTRIQAPGALTADRFSVSARVEEPAERAGTARATLPAERMEVILVGYREMPDLPAEETILRQAWP